LTIGAVTNFLAKVTSIQLVLQVQCESLSIAFNVYEMIVTSFSWFIDGQKMRSGMRQQAWIVCLVLGCHLAVLALTLAHSSESVTKAVPPPTIIGVMLAPPPVAKPLQPEPVAPKPLTKPVTQPTKPVAKPIEKTTPKTTPKKTPTAKPKPRPLPKAEASEKAITAPVAEPSIPTKTEPHLPSTPSVPTIQPPSAQAQGLNNQPPVYPQLSRKKKEQGTVLLLLMVKADGTVGEVQITTSSGFSRLDQAAIQAVKRWNFQPAQQQGKSIDFWYELPLTFRLN
jgi:periplasmic protein TonB